MLTLFFYNKLVIPPNRLEAAFWVYQCSIITSIIAISQVPYTSAIMGHERMNIYAYISIFEAIAKLLIVYFLTMHKESNPTLPLFERDYIRVKNEQKKKKIFFIAYSVAVAGNIGKVAAYQGNPFAINIAIWCKHSASCVFFSPLFLPTFVASL